MDNKSLMDCVREVVLAIDPETYHIIYANKTLINMTGRDVTGEFCYRALHKKDTPCSFCAVERLKKDKSKHWHREIRNSILERYFSVVSRMIQWPDGRDVVVECAIDITSSKRAEHILQETSDRYRKLFESTGTATILCEADMTISLVSTEFERLIGYPRHQLEGVKKVTELFDKIEAQRVISHYQAQKTARRPVPNSIETWLSDRFQNKKYLIVNISYLPGSLMSIFSFHDITDRKIAEQKLEYLGFHDPLTGLYNRVFFDEKMRCFEEQRLYPLAIVMCDFDGLKYINDTLGHSGGDRLLVVLANILTNVSRPEDIIARVGGDEFAILLPIDDGEAARALCSKITETTKNYSDGRIKEGIHVSVSYAVRHDTSKSLRDVYIEADNNMYREKLHHERSSRSAVVQTLGRALEARDFITEGHTERIQNLVEYLAEAEGIRKNKLADLRLFARFHDIGKIGISDSILFKEGPLTQQERQHMNMHPQIGCSIAMSSSDLQPIADWILKHHEWWNGGGYPLGIKKEKIPIECRMLSIADAFDAMTNDRPYRKAMSHSEAIAELKRCSGTQFDPYLVEKFINLPIIANEEY